MKISLQKIVEKFRMPRFHTGKSWNEIKNLRILIPKGTNHFKKGFIK